VPPISPIEEEPEYAASPGERPWDNQAAPAAVASPREPTSPAVPLRGTTDAHAQPDQAAAGYAARRGPMLMGPPRPTGVGAADPSAPFAHAVAHAPVGESPGAGLGRRGQAWDGPGFGFGLHSPAVKPVKAVEDVPPPPPVPLKVCHILRWSTLPGNYNLVILEGPALCHSTTSLMLMFLCSKPSLNCVNFNVSSSHSLRKHLKSTIQCRPA
jgi:hypothetical protein